MKIEEIVKPYSHIRLATLDDNKDILNFYNNIVMETSKESISFDRGDDFFAFYKLTTNKFWTFLFLNDDDSIAGIGSILRHIRIIDGRLTPVAYFCDLRMSPIGGRRAKVQWRKLFVDLIKNFPHLDEEEKCELAYTAILADNSVAINSLGKSNRGITYKYINTYEINSVMLISPFLPGALKYEEISKEDFLAFYLKNSLKNLSLTENVIWRSSYYAIYDQGKVVAVFEFNASGEGRQFKVKNLSGINKFLTNTLPLIGKPKFQETLKTCEICNITPLGSTSISREVEVTILKFIRDNGINQNFHLCNIGYSNNRSTFQQGIDGLSVQTIGNMYEIHLEGGPAKLKSTDFVFEGAFL